jgi:hypothetical protein
LAGGCWASLISPAMGGASVDPAERIVNFNTSYRMTLLRDKRSSADKKFTGS